MNKKYAPMDCEINFEPNEEKDSESNLEKINMEVEKIVNNYQSYDENQENSNFSVLRQENEEDKENLSNKINEEENKTTLTEFSPNKYNKKSKNEIRNKFKENIKKYFLKNYNEEIDKPDTDEFNLLSFNKLKKLKKKSQIEKEEKLKKSISMNYFDYEAELGSDNEDHDDIVKKITKSEEEDSEKDEDENLKDLIDNNEQVFDEDYLQKKFFEDMLMKDSEEIRRVISGPERDLINRKRQREEEDEQDTIQNRIRKSTVNEEENIKFSVKNLYKNIKRIEKKLKEEGEEQEDNEELNSIYSNLESKIKMMIEKKKEGKKDFYSRLKENEKILKHVIILNTNDNENKLNENENKFFIKGVKSQVEKSEKSTGHLNHTTVIKTTTDKSFNKYNFNHKNSFLHAMKNDKYYKKEIAENSLTSQNSLEKESNSNQISNKNYSIFANKKNISQNPNVSSNLSALFTRSNKSRHNDGQLTRQVKESLATPSKESLRKLLD
jgi:hypothetical protein